MENAIGVSDATCSELTILISDYIRKQDVRTRTELGVIISQHLECGLPRTPEDIDERREWVARLWLGVVDSLNTDSNRWLSDLDFLDDSAWSSILAESDAQAPDAANLSGRLEDTIFRYRTDSARRSLESSPAFFEWLESSVGRPVSRDLRLTYVYYARQDQSCEVHIDHESVYPYNCLIGLRHVVPPTGEKSMLRLYSQGRVSDIEVPVRGAVLFNSCRTPHGRTTIARGESLQLLSIGVTPVARE